MNKTILTTIYNQTYELYNSEAFLTEDLRAFIEEYEAEVELALEAYYRYEEELGAEIAQRAWGVYDLTRNYNKAIITALKDIIEERGEN